MARRSPEQARPRPRGPPRVPLRPHLQAALRASPWRRAGRRLGPARLAWAAGRKRKEAQPRKAPAPLPRPASGSFIIFFFPPSFPPPRLGAGPGRAGAYHLKGQRPVQRLQAGPPSSPPGPAAGRRSPLGPRPPAPRGPGGPPSALSAGSAALAGGCPGPRRRTQPRALESWPGAAACARGPPGSRSSSAPGPAPSGPRDGAGGGSGRREPGGERAGGGEGEAAPWKLAPLACESRGANPGPPPPWPSFLLPLWPEPLGLPDFHPQLPGRGREWGKSFSEPPPPGLGGGETVPDLPRPSGLLRAASSLCRAGDSTALITRVR
ncbi:uncharacterized protein LOC141558056 [Sminthopsis crassicaudata]|uniref:uncharacterized protein LOC141558056 n=1 Tax=Sminthopsis crassicaudata TaxID=9301 RepID=UPI003D689FE4